MNLVLAGREQRDLFSGNTRKGNRLGRDRGTGRQGKLGLGTQETEEQGIRKQGIWELETEEFIFREQGYDCKCRQVEIREHSSPQINCCEPWGRTCMW